MLSSVQRIDAVLGGVRGTGVRTITTILVLALACAPSAAAKGVIGHAHGSAEQVYTTAAKPGTHLTLVDRHGHAVQTRRVDSLGALLFRNVAPGKGYRLRSAAAARGRTLVSSPITVFSDRSAPPSTRIYKQRIPAKGYGYLTTRDGVKLALDVHLPAGTGPYPTLIEYAGYGYADPFHGFPLAPRFSI